MNKEIEENFYEKRREGENDDYLCELIRNNEIKEFITFTEQRNLSLENKIKKSIFEANQLLTDAYYITLIEYTLYHNYCFFPTNMKYKNMFFYLCEYDYYALVELYLSEGVIDVNDKIKISII